MDWSWLGDIFSAIKSGVQWIAKHLWSDIWHHLSDLYQRIRGWYQWYQHNVQQPMQAAQQNFRKLYDHFVLPILKIVDLVRRITGLVGLFNKRLAGKLNLLFLRIEQNMLLPLQLYTQRINALSHLMGGFLTPLGFLDRATLLNSAWRDIGQLRSLLRNPYGEIVPAGTLPQTPTMHDQVLAVTDSIDTDSGAVSSRVDIGFLSFQELIATA